MTTSHFPTRALWRASRGTATRAAFALVVATLLAACQVPGTEHETDMPADGGTAAAADADGDEVGGAQAAADAVRAREALPGRGDYVTYCAHCHDGPVKKAPHREMIALMTPEAILATMTDGIMRAEAAPLDDAERARVAEYLGGRPLGSVATTAIPACSTDVALDTDAPPRVANWGMQKSNHRYVPPPIAGLTRSDLQTLKPRWALNFPGANRARSQPLLAGGLLFTGSHGGVVYALDPRTGCSVWTFQASGEVRTGFAIDPWARGAAGEPNVYFGDVLGNVYAVSARSGTLTWRARADEHPNATITGTPSLHDGRLYAPVSALEVSLAVDPTYECCTFRGSVVAYDARNGERLWQTYTIKQAPVPQSRNAAGTIMRGPSGAVIWNSPAIDAARGQLYVGTGENMSSPATLTSDAIFAIDLASGAVNWVFQATANDVWNTACDTDTPQSCPPEGGPDFDFGAATILASTTDGRDLVLAGQKSGAVHALDPDSGALVWQNQVGRGGIQGGIHFGMAAHGDTLFVPITDMPDGRTYSQPARPGLHALDIRTGESRDITSQRWAEAKMSSGFERSYAFHVAPGALPTVRVRRLGGPPTDKHARPAIDHVGLARM